jgi:hypothetical protein
MKLRKAPLRDGDVHWLEAGVAVDLGLLAVQAAPRQTSLERPRQTNLEKTRCQEPPNM